MLEPGDLLFNRTNSPELVGKSAVFRRGTPSMLFASYLIRVQLGPECLPEWAAMVINGPIGRAYVASVRTQQVGQANVNGTKLAAMPIPLPPLDEQRRIVAEVEQRLSVIDAMAAASAAARPCVARSWSGRSGGNWSPKTPPTRQPTSCRSASAPSAPPRRPRGASRVSDPAYSSATTDE